MNLSRTLLAVLAALPAAAAIAPAAASAADQTFTAPGQHAFTVPAGVTSVQVTLVGGRGAPGNGGNTGIAPGGAGATVTATFTVPPLRTLYAQVGGNGLQNGAGGYGGGGKGGPVVALLSGVPGGGGGGGASAVRVCAEASCAPLVIAGGGGGGGGAGLDSTPSISGGDGGTAGQPGSDGEADYSRHDAGGAGGKAGTQSAGGAAGANSYESPATAGHLFVGGDGGTSIGGGGGGGGGGLFGGGGGGAGYGYADFYAPAFFSGAGGGGGGGSSGVPGGTAGVSGYSLLSTADGAGPSVTFSWTPPAPAPPAVPAQSSGGPAGSPAAAALPPLVTGLRLSRSRLRRGAGTTVKFGLSAAAVARLTFERVTQGRIAGHRCSAATRARRHGKRCTRRVRVPGAVQRAAAMGVNGIRFTGVLDGGRRLRPGAYRLSLVAVDAAGHASPARRAAVTILG